MAQPLVSLLVHVIFSTKSREPLITPELEPELYVYIGGTLKNHESRLLDADGTVDHPHLLVSQSKNIALSSLMKDVKKDSSLYQDEGKGISKLSLAGRLWWILDWEN